VEYRNLGKSGLQVSVVGLGCNNFGMRLDAAATKAVVEKCLDMGVTFFDTADSYGRGQSEEYLGAALKGQRRKVVIATKSVSPMGEGPYWAGASRKYLMDAVDDCLRRLGTDYIDLYQMHRPDARTPIEETLRALEDMVRAGKVRYIGSSNYSGWQVVEADWVARTQHLTRFISAQNQYSLLERGIERDLVPGCQQYGVSILPFFPLASGFLTGKYRQGEAAPEGARLAGPMGGRVLNERNFETLGKLESFAHEAGHSILELAIGWLATKPYIGSVIAGATKPEQVEENVKAAEWKLTDEEMKKVDEIMGVGQGMGRR
jgi:aryl-alcohol dehydrogenase-like predicted oxidoreductase